MQGVCVCVCVCVCNLFLVTKQGVQHWLNIKVYLKQAELDADKEVYICPFQRRYSPKLLLSEMSLYYVSFMKGCASPS